MSVSAKTPLQQPGCLSNSMTCFSSQRGPNQLYVVLVRHQISAEDGAVSWVS
jgi:hypothetical protein